MSKTLLNNVNLFKCHRRDWYNYDFFRDILSEDEMQKLDSYKIADDKMRFYIGKIMAKVIVSSYLKKDAKNIRFITNQYGKPYLENNNGFLFNISHSGDWVIAVFANYEVGVDVQQLCIDKKMDFANIAKHAFHKDEIAYINEAKEAEKHIRFYDIWSVKEAIIKARGIGFYGNLTEFCVLPIYDDKVFVVDNLQVMKKNLDAKHVLAIAVDCDAPTHITEHNFNDFRATV
jgi:4'-phosphopantetheinyl transferase